MYYAFPHGNLINFVITTVAQTNSLAEVLTQFNLITGRRSGWRTDQVC